MTDSVTKTALFDLLITHNMYKTLSTGHDVGSLFLTAPSVSVMLGPMSRPIIKRKAMEKKGPKTAVSDALK